MKHSTIGVWDLYELPARQQTSPHSWRAVVQSLPYVWRMMRDIASIPQCWPLLAAYLLVDFLASLVPAIALSYSAQLLTIVQVAVDTRTVDARLLVSVVAGSFCSALATRLLRSAKQRVSNPLHARIKLYYSQHIFRAFARLDVPTFDDPHVQRQLDHCFPKHSHSSIPFAAVSASLHVITTAIQLTSQLSVLVAVLKDQQDGPLLAVLCFLLAFFQWNKAHKPFISNGVWAATTTDEDYIKSEGLKRLVNNPVHRKEIVAGGLAPYLLAQYRAAVSRIADRAGDFHEAVAAHQRSRDAFSASIVLHELLRGLPEIVFALRAVRHPATLPLSLASLHLITQTTQSFTYAAFALADEAGGIAERLEAVRLLYEVTRIPNVVRVRPREKEGTPKAKQEDDEDIDDDERAGVPFPEDTQSLRSGVSVEFRDVSFKYPGCTSYALRNVSFRIERGQLCVIVGNNGSGKSTILKLVARLYDPASGVVLVDGHDVRTLRLADLRRAAAVLFQDYTLFPLSIRDNIALGAPPSALHPGPGSAPPTLAQVQQAARLGGAAEFVRTLPRGWDTYLERPVQDYYSAGEGAGAGEEGEEMEGKDRPVNPKELLAWAQAEREGSRSEKTRSGREEDEQADGALDERPDEVDDGIGGGARSRGVSGGQMQRIALSRTFMRSVVADDSVGLLLFDEPSASLDPTAEHDLFERLRTLRGNKTMVFSSHRFGNLTRHADLILYMNDAVVQEEGTHEQLLRRGGEYARIWMLQARAFL